MFKSRQNAKTQLLEKSTEVAEVLTERLHELSKQAEKQAAALEARVKRPQRKNPVLKFFAFSFLLAAAAIVYGVREYLKDEHSTEATSPYAVSA